MASASDNRLLAGPAGDVVLRPWFDFLALRALTRWYFPLSRAWAAALASGGDLTRLLAALGLEESPRGRQRALAAQLSDEALLRAAGYGEATAEWEAALFGNGAMATGRLIQVELARQEAAQRLMAARRYALPLHWRRPLPAVRWEIESPEWVAREQGARLAELDAAFAVPPLRAVEASRGLPGACGRESWLRFAAPVLGDTAWAHLYEDPGAKDPPTLIYLHGIAMETEMWRHLVDGVNALARGGVRVLRPEGPWHGRRRAEGWYGGEPAMGRGPAGFLDLFHAWVAEVAVLIDWARRTSRGPVAVGGVSLGALTAQLVATAASNWPERLRPDALFLVATGGSVRAIREEGSLSRALAFPARLREAGWTGEELDRWLPLLEPRGEPGLPAERIVMLLGRADDLVPFGGGLALARRWRVPAANLFLRPQGHFSVALGLCHDPAPLRRLAALLGAA